MTNLVCSFELVDDDLSILVKRLEAIFRLCDRNPKYFVVHDLQIHDTNTLFIKIYKND